MKTNTPKKLNLFDVHAKAIEKNHNSEIVYNRNRTFKAPINTPPPTPRVDNSKEKYKVNEENNNTVKNTK
jgi:hypothetical protein